MLMHPVAVGVEQLERTGVLVYDADCGFCARFAAWSGPAVPWQDLDLDAAGTTADEMARAAGWLDGGRVVATGAAAIAAALAHRAGPWRLVGRALQAPLVRLASGGVYRVVARNRHRMPGGTATCRVPVEPRQPSRLVMWSAMVVILLLGLLTLGLSNDRREPYPGLMMPGFGYNPDNGDGTETVTAVAFRATMPDGRTVSVRGDQLLPRSGPGRYMLAQTIFDDPTRASSPEVRAWLVKQLDRFPRTRGAIALTAYDVATRYTIDQQRIDRSVTPRLTLSLTGVR